MNDDLKTENKALRSAYKREKLARREAESLLEDKIRVLIENSQLIKKQYKELKHTHHRMNMLQNKLVQSRQMQMIGQVVAGLLHELNNPLASIQSNAEFIVSCNDEKERLEIYGDIRKGIKRIGTLIESLSLKRKQSSSKLNLMNLIQLAAKIAQSSDIAVLKINYIGDFSHLMIIGDRQDLTQLFLNIFLVISENIDEPMHVNIHVKHRNKVLIIDILDKDKGIDIPLDNRIFEPFYTMKNHVKISGIGLYTSFIICQQYRGKMKVIQKASTKLIRLTLPIVCE